MLSQMNPSVDPNIMPWPQELNQRDRSDFVTVASFQCTYNYIPDSTVGENYNVGSVRSSQSIPCNCLIYYFEMKVLSQGEKGSIGIGITPNGSRVDRMPGWEDGTIGYHGDDGSFFHQTGYGADYGPKFSRGDVVGCGIVIEDGKVFFTKNGTFLGMAPSSFPKDIFHVRYPTIGLHSKHEAVEVNFGQEPFVFDISNVWSPISNSIIATTGKS